MMLFMLIERKLGSVTFHECQGLLGVSHELTLRGFIYAPEAECLPCICHSSKL